MCEFAGNISPRTSHAGVNMGPVPGGSTTIYEVTRGQHKEFTFNQSRPIHTADMAGADHTHSYTAWQSSQQNATANQVTIPKNLGL